MFKKVSLAVLTVGVLFASCKKDFKTQGTQNGSFNRSASASVDIDPRTFTGQPTATIPSTITGSYTLTAGTTWLLDGPTFVQNGGVLTIEPNVLIKGLKVSTSGDPSYLVVTAGGRIEADGNGPTTSIVFTSDQGANAQPGDWGGLIILGNARSNNATSSTRPKIEGIDASEIPAGYSIEYGSNTDANNTASSGTLRYVRIEFAGRDLLSGLGNEINGLTLGGVGSGTTLSHIMVSYGFDDSFEFFGGTVNADHLISYACSDDDFDFDNGYSGSISYAVSLRNPDVVLTTDPNGIESDNDAGSSSNSPITKPVLRYFTILGTPTREANLLYGNRWRRNSSLDIQYSIVAGYDEAAVFFDGSAVQTHLNTAGDGIFANNFYHGFLAGISSAGTPGSPWTNVSANTSTSADPGLVSPYTIGNPDFRYTNSALAGYGAFGSSGSSRWDDDWASYDPLLNAY